MKVGDTITLKPKSKHGKDRVAQHGTKWTVVKVETICSRPAAFLESLKETFQTSPGNKTKDARWVHLENDLDFEIKEGS